MTSKYIYMLVIIALCNYLDIRKKKESIVITSRIQTWETGLSSVIRKRKIRFEAELRESR